MKWLTDKMAEFHTETKKSYRDAQEEGIETTFDYIQEYDSELPEKAEFNGAATVRESIKTLAADAHWDTFYRCFPYTGEQPFMLITNNPGMPGAHRFLKYGEGRLYNQAESTDDGLDPAEIAQVYAHYIAGWLADSRIPSLFNKIAEAGPTWNADTQFGDYQGQMDRYFQTAVSRHWRTFAQYQMAADPKPVREFDCGVEVDLEQGFINDFYYTTAYKYSTLSSSDIPEERPVELAKEIEIVGPELLFVSGATAWNTVRTAFDLNDASENITEAQGQVYTYSPADTDSGPSRIIALRHPNTLGGYADTVNKLHDADLVAERVDPDS